LKWVKVNGKEFTAFTPDQMIEYQMDASNSHKFDMVDLMQGFINSNKGRAGYKRKIRGTIRSFFLHNRVELPRDPSFIIRGEVQKVIGNLTLEEAKTVILSCNEGYRTLFLCMLQGGMGKAEAEYWNMNGWLSLQEQLKHDPEVIKVDLPGRKLNRNIRPYYTLLGSDALHALKTYIQIRPPGAKEIFVNKYGDPVTAGAMTQYWTRHLRKSGLIGNPKNGNYSNRYGKNLHELRTLFRSQWEKSSAKISVAEYLMGHTVDPLDYNQAFKDEEWTKSEYLKALPMLEILSSGRPFGLVETDRVLELERQNEELREKMKELENPNLERFENLASQVTELRKQLEALLQQK
jgi:integrase